MRFNLGKRKQIFIFQDVDEGSRCPNEYVPEIVQ